ncbi:MAG: glutaredoxin 3 [Endozoicomonas sp. (ex Botrylloides leachii)]|nr:glutaredoxin 3 [Endozoicomonas sp. (ex Botrylloides leachii)]
MDKTTIYTSQYCPYCIKALDLLNAKGVTYTNISIDSHPDIRVEMTKKAGSHTVPQIWIGETHVGGCDELYALEHKGQLDRLLKS